MSFEFVQQGARALFMHDGQAILICEENVGYFGGVWQARDQWLEPGGGAEVASLPIFAWIAYPNAPTKVAYDVLADGERLKVAIRPLRTQKGTAALELIDECCTLSVELADGRYLWTQRLRTEARRDIDVDRLGKDSLLWVYTLAQPAGTPGRYMQFADPLPVGARDAGRLMVAADQRGLRLAAGRRTDLRPRLPGRPQQLQ